MIATLSSLGLPLLNGFIGEFIILRGTYEVSIKYAAWAVIGIILGAAYLLWLYQRVMFGPVTNPANEHLPDLNAREYATLIPLDYSVLLDRHLSEAAVPRAGAARAADRRAGQSRVLRRGTRRRARGCSALWPLRHASGGTCMACPE